VSVALAVGLCAGLATFAARSARAQSEGTTGAIRLGESGAGNAVADAVRAAAGTPVALVPAAAFRTGVPVPARASADTLAALLDPPSDLIAVLNLSGAQLKDALERSVRYGSKGFAGFLQVSGIKLTVDSSKPDGQRVVSVSVGGQPLDPDKKYKVATTRPLANGASGYFQIWTKDDLVGEGQKTLAAAIREWAASKGGEIALSADGRITVRP
jgi:5'-nucleotidase / UDP-sugar diphosphatase